MRRFSLICALLGLLAACSPALNWRSISLADAVLSHPFWTSAGAACGANLLHFAKNLGLVGGLLLLAGTGGGKRR